MQFYIEKNDLLIFDIVKNNSGIISTLVDIVMDYIGICMYCQQDTYPMYKKNIYGYRICIDCIWANLSDSFKLKYRKKK